jgi:hypothetical protein
MMIDFKRPNTPSTAIPSNMNGSKINQTMGYNINARTARGQQKINSNIHAMNVII